MTNKHALYCRTWFLMCSCEWLHFRPLRQYWEPDNLGLTPLYILYYRMNACLCLQIYRMWKNLILRPILWSKFIEDLLVVSHKIMWGQYVPGLLPLRKVLRLTWVLCALSCTCMRLYCVIKCFCFFYHPSSATSTSEANCWVSSSASDCCWCVWSRSSVWSQQASFSPGKA